MIVITLSPSEMLCIAVENQSGGSEQPSPSQIAAMNSPPTLLTPVDSYWAPYRASKTNVPPTDRLFGDALCLSLSQDA